MPIYKDDKIACVLLLCAFLIFGLTACNESQVKANETEFCGSKTLFSTWSTDVDFKGFKFGSTTYRQEFTIGGPVIDCEFDVEITGSECSGTVKYTKGLQVDEGSFRSSYCSDRVGSYSYAKDSAGLVYGRVGTRPIIYE